MSKIAAGVIALVLATPAGAKKPNVDDPAPPFEAKLMEGTR